MATYPYPAINKASVDSAAFEGKGAWLLGR
jgi:hypothetical protein